MTARKDSPNARNGLTDARERARKLILVDAADQLGIWADWCPIQGGADELTKDGEILASLIEREILAAEQAARQRALEEVMRGIKREQDYHEFLEEKHAEMRHPILACKSIASWVNALMNTSALIEPAPSETQKGGTQ